MANKDGEYTIITAFVFFNYDKRNFQIMFISDICTSASSPEKRRNYFHKRKLEMLTMYRDSLERRISAISASIKTLEEQIARDSQLSE